MNKTDLTKAVAEKAEVTNAEAARALNAFFDIVTKSLSEGEAVTIVGFGTFNVANRAARSGRNPQTGQAIKIAARKSPRFSPGKQLKEACNRG